MAENTTVQIRTSQENRERFEAMKSLLNHKSMEDTLVYLMNTAEEADKFSSSLDAHPDHARSIEDFTALQKKLLDLFITQTDLIEASQAKAEQAVANKMAVLEERLKKLTDLKAEGDSIMLKVNEENQRLKAENASLKAKLEALEDVNTLKGLIDRILSSQEQQKPSQEQEKSVQKPSQPSQEQEKPAQKPSQSSQEQEKPTQKPSQPAQEQQESVKVQKYGMMASMAKDLKREQS